MVCLGVGYNDYSKVEAKIMREFRDLLRDGGRSVMVNELNPDSQCSYGGDATVGAEISTALDNKGNSAMQREDDNWNSMRTANAATTTAPSSQELTCNEDSKRVCWDWQEKKEGREEADGGLHRCKSCRAETLQPGQAALAQRKTGVCHEEPGAQESRPERMANCGATAGGKGDEGLVNHSSAPQSLAQEVLGCEGAVVSARRYR